MGEIALASTRVPLPNKRDGEQNTRVATLPAVHFQLGWRWVELKGVLRSDRREQGLPVQGRQPPYSEFDFALSAGAPTVLKGAAARSYMTPTGNERANAVPDRESEDQPHKERDCDSLQIRKKRWPSMP